LRTDLVIIHRAELRRAGAGRWSVTFNGEQIVTASQDPEPAAWAALLARGVRGHITFCHARGTISCGMAIEDGAALAKKCRPLKHSASLN